jgi:hypothetical protein
MDHFILTTPVTDLNVSPEFLKMSQANGFEKLEDILSTPLHLFASLPESGYRMLREFVNILNDNGLGHLASN